MSLAAPVRSGAALQDSVAPRPVLATRLSHTGMVFDVRVDEVDLGRAGVVSREYVEHPGAALIVALRPIGGVDHICLIRQYRHPVGCFLWELPAGLLDVSGEPVWQAAARELAEEVRLRAARWDVLIDNFASPGGFGEAVRIFLARDLTDTEPPAGFVPHGEEVDLEVAWVPLDEAYQAVLAGRLHSPSAVIGIMAAYGARAAGWATLRPHDAPWPEHPGLRSAVATGEPAGTVASRTTPPGDGGYVVSTDPAAVDREVVWTYLHTEAYWGRWRDRQTVERQLDRAWRVAGVVETATGATVGFARAISDGLSVAYLADVFVLAEHRGRGLGRRLVAAMVDDEVGARLRWMLHTVDGHGLYRRFGFREPDGRYLEREPGHPVSGAGPADEATQVR